jgi:hypothetical protein
MMRNCKKTLMLAAALLSAPASAAPPNMKEGLWEITTKMEMPGMPAGMKPQVMQQCITKKDLEDPRRTTPGNDPNSNRCQVADYKVQGNTATWNMACKGEGAMTGSGTITYSGNSYSGTSKMTMNHGGQAQNLTMHYSGRRIGECRK